MLAEAGLRVLAECGGSAGPLQRHTYDRRGHGKTEVPLYGYSLWNQTHDLKCLLDLVGIEQSVIAAVAMGTTIDVTFTLQYPDHVRALVLCAWYELDGFPLLEPAQSASNVVRRLPPQDARDFARARP